jgi:hypothetical protein
MSVKKSKKERNRRKKYLGCIEDNIGIAILKSCSITGSTILFIDYYLEIFEGAKSKKGEWRRLPGASLGGLRKNTGRASNEPS